MAGFFKKLFNRVVGVKDEAPPPPAVEEVVVPSAPEPEAAPERDPDAPAEWIMRELLAHEQAPPAPPEPEPMPEPEAPQSAPEIVLEAIAPPPPAEAAAALVVEEPSPKKTAKKKEAPPKVEAKKPEPPPRKPIEKKIPAAKVEVKKQAAAKPKAKAVEPPPVKPAPAPAKPAPPKPAPPSIEAKPAKSAAALKAKAEARPVEVKPPPAPAVSPPAAPLPPPVEIVRPAPEPQPAPPPPPVEIAPAEPGPPAPPTPKAGQLAKPAAVPAPAPAPEPRGWLSRLRHGLSKSSRSITSSITSIFTKKKLDAATLQDLEDVLLQADLGLPMAERIVKAVSAGRFDREIDPDEVKRILAEEVAKVLKPVEVPFNFGAEKPFVILVVGVNGSGKTTTIGKLGAIARSEGFKVMFAACDTFRAAAIEQLTVWGKRIGARTISRPTGADSSGLAFDAMKEAGEDGTDILFIDTAGRLQNKAYLMDELDKVVRVIKKRDATAPHAVLLVLDATTGQNAIAQADVFSKVAGVTGLIMTKLDGTARGGILVAIAEKFQLPVHAIGVGEQIDDLQPFDAEAFSRAIAGLDEP